MNNQHDQHNPLSAFANSIQEEADSVQKMHDEATAKAEDIRKEKGIPDEQEADGDRAPEEFDLFKVVVDSITNVVTSPSIQQAFVSLRDKFNRLGSADATVDTGDISRELVEIISMSVSYSVIMSIEFYDQQLKRSLEKDFAAENEVLTRIESDLLATTMKVLTLEKQILSNMTKPASDE